MMTDSKEELEEHVPVVADFHFRRAPDMQLGKCELGIRVREDVTYIVAGILLRENEENGEIEILLIQETKKECYGKWYLPAGRCEPGETIEEATMREVKEEAGFRCRLDNMISMEVDSSKSTWYRFAFACSIIGGKLKTFADEESLGAGWHSIQSVKSDSIQLRCSDFLNVMEEGVKYYHWQNSLSPSINEFPPILTKHENENGLYLEFVIVVVGSSSKRVKILVHQSIEEETDILTCEDAFPTIEFGTDYPFQEMVKRCYRHILKDGFTALEPPSAVASVTCLPTPRYSIEHGLRARVICYHQRNLSKSTINDPERYRWMKVKDPEVLAHLSLNPGQFQTKLFM